MEEGCGEEEGVMGCVMMMTLYWLPSNVDLLGPCLFHCDLTVVWLGLMVLDTVGWNWCTLFALFCTIIIIIIILFFFFGLYAVDY